MEVLGSYDNLKLLNDSVRWVQPANHDHQHRGHEGHEQELPVKTEGS